MSDATIAGERVRELMSELDKLSDDYEGTVKVLTTFARSERLAALEEAGKVLSAHVKWDSFRKAFVWTGYAGQALAAIRALEGDAG